MRGRKPTPAELQDLRGNPGRRSTAKKTPRAAGELAEAPDWLDAEQRAGWAYALAHAPKGVLKRIDRGAMTVWVLAESLHRKAALEVMRYGLVVKAPKTDQPMQSPFLAIVNRQGLIMLKAAAELGFTPASRPRLVGASGGGDWSTSGEENGIPKAQGALGQFLAADPRRLH
jgi:P27 family predicted phage terminase small subunit